MKDLSIEKLDERNTGNYHIIRKMNEVVEAVNTLIEGMQEIEKQAHPLIEVQDGLPDSED